MEWVILVVIVILVWSFRKTINTWAHTSEVVSESTARKVLVNTAKQDVSTAKEVQALLADEDFHLDRNDMDAFLFDGRRPKPQGETNE